MLAAVEWTKDLFIEPSDAAAAAAAALKPVLRKPLPVVDNMVRRTSYGSIPLLLNGYICFFVFDSLLA